MRIEIIEIPQIVGYGRWEIFVDGENKATIVGTYHKKYHVDYILPLPRNNFGYDKLDVAINSVISEEIIMQYA